MPPPALTSALQDRSCSSSINNVHVFPLLPAGLREATSLLVVMTLALEQRIGTLLRGRGQTLGVAESCTGGLIAHRLTNMAGSSEYFLGGIVAYSNTIKIKQLNVSPQTLEEHGAVSEQSVLEMARGARRALGADIALSVSGIAGPEGGKEDKPVGTVWIGLATPDGEWARRFHFDGDREQNKAAFSDAALILLLEYLQRKSEAPGAAVP